MKSYNSLVIIVVVIFFSLFSDISTGALKPSTAPQASSATDELVELFNVKVAKEPVYLILVEKNLQRLRVLEFDNELRVVADYPVATGENFGIKEISGDEKTPEGIYFITQIFRDDKITIFGDKAFHLDYPNFFDQEAGRNGDGIYIHGTNKKLEPNSTNGCVTLANRDLDDLESYLTQVVTPVVIVQELGSITKSKTQLLTENDFTLAKSLLLTEQIKPDNVEYNYLYIVNFGNQTVAVSDFIYRPFKRTIMRGASRTYLEYFPKQGWTARKRIWRVSPLQIYPETPVKVAAHPLATGEVQLTEQSAEDSAAMVAALTPQNIPQQDSSQNEQLHAEPQLFSNTQPGIPKKLPAKEIIPPDKELHQRAPVTAAKAPPTPAPMKTAAYTVSQQQKIMVAPPVIPKYKQQIKDFVEDWRQAWVSQEIDPYIAFYDKNFRSSGKNLAEWKAHKAKLNKSYTYINVDISNITVSWTDEGASVSFRQVYRSDRYSATGNKTLYLIHDDHGWKIKREVYSRI
ncbi:MAG: L,D-transpeptidase family protein [Deltaproteobacteria bacterium]|nr:MAG: L,D-transpeptidase family protein [Deltaproteobacteria bacterium]